MIPLRDHGRKGPLPWVTITIVILLAVIYLWDRQWAVFGPRITFVDLAVRPVDVVNALQGGDRDPLLTLFTSVFLHGNFQHILFNVLFLAVFGPRVENHFGPVRFILYYLFWGVFAAGAQIFVMPESGVPMLGASGAIAGVMGSYLLLYPASDIEVMIPPFFWLTFAVPAWLLLSLWFVFQVFLAQPGVANWAHVGGFLGGVLIVLLTGGKKGSVSEMRRREHGALSL